VRARSVGARALVLQLRNTGRHRSPGTFFVCGLSSVVAQQRAAVVADVAVARPPCRRCCTGTRSSGSLAGASAPHRIPNVGPCPRAKPATPISAFTRPAPKSRPRRRATSAASCRARSTCLWLACWCCRALHACWAAAPLALLARWGAGGQSRARWLDGGWLVLSQRVARPQAPHALAVMMLLLCPWLALRTAHGLTHVRRVHITGVIPSRRACSCPVTRTRGSPPAASWPRPAVLATAGARVSAAAAPPASIHPRPASPSACLTVETRCGDHTGNLSSCPVPDLTYLEEYYSLDTDCSDGLSMDEFRHTTTLFDQPSYLVLIHYPLPRRVSDFARTMIDRKWAEVFAAADADRDEQLSFLEWLRLFRDYKPTFRHCGQALRDRFYRLANTLGRRPSGAFPIKPCATCPEYWWAAAVLARIQSVWWRDGCDWDPPYLARSCNKNEAKTIVTGSSASRACTAVVGTSCTVR
jgi:hypothetical protein